ncbi:MAG: twin-arginine translocase TatA/TatE family subunit [Candidatus Sulfotelmatobacter sp.]
MSFSETIFLFFLALIIFGPKKLPEIARQVGKVLNEFRRASNEFKLQIEQEIAHLDVETKKQTILPPNPAPEGTASRTLSSAPSETYPAPASSAEAAAAGTGAVESTATAVASDDEPLFATAIATAPAIAPAAADPPAAASEASASPTTEAVTASASQESHV